jgi:energy-coupling factor transporter ATP-binding protein EcfA2
VSEHQFGVDLEGVGLEVKGGEILGIAGVAGNGQSELMEALIGERLAASPRAILIDGTPVGSSGPTARRALGMCFVPEERLGHGSVPEMSLWENAVLTAKGRMHLSTLGFIGARPRALPAVVADFDVRTPGATTHAALGRNLRNSSWPRDAADAVRADCGAADWAWTPGPPPPSTAAAVAGPGRCRHPDVSQDPTSCLPSPPASPSSPTAG